ncbi:MAG: universal stress protein [Acidimicrobiales bacterium]|jgi:nucleotide-binding universal stress UspA family protein
MSTIIVCTDGSDLSIDAARRGISILGPSERTILVSVNTDHDPTLVTGAGGFAGPTMNQAEYDAAMATANAAAETALEQTANALGLEGVEREVLGGGDAGPAVVAFATEVGADAIVMGSRGRGGLKRAVLGSVSDHIVRNAPCTVVITGAAAD